MVSGDAVELGEVQLQIGALFEVSAHGGPVSSNPTGDPRGLELAIDLTRIELRHLTADDWRLWRDVRLRALAEAPHAFGSTLAAWQGGDELEPRWRSRLTEVPTNVVALVGGDAAGQASGTALDEHGRIDLISMWVDPRHRGTGIGLALIEEIVADAGRRGARAVALSVKVDNDRARARYRRAGFVETDEAPHEPDELRMERGVRPQLAG